MLIHNIYLAEFLGFIYQKTFFLDLFHVDYYPGHDSLYMEIISKKRYTERQEKEKERQEKEKERQAKISELNKSIEACNKHLEDLDQEVLKYYEMKDELRAKTRTLLENKDKSSNAMYKKSLFALNKAFNECDIMILNVDICETTERLAWLETEKEFLMKQKY